MTSLRERLAARPGTDVLIREGVRDVTVAEALAEGPKGLPLSARVLLSLHDTGALARTLVALDGGVEALLLASYSFSPEVIDALAQAAGITHIVTDRAELLAAATSRPVLAPAAVRGPAEERAPVATTWLMTTSGTTGVPKIVTHSVASLTR